MNAKDLIKESERMALIDLEAMKEHADSRALFYECLKRYIIHRFLIDDGFWDDDLLALARHSIALTKKRTGGDTGLSDLGINCAGASSATTKHLLLVLSLQKGLGVRLDPDDVAAAGTVHSLAALLLSALRAGENV